MPSDFAWQDYKPESSWNMKGFMSSRTVWTQWQFSGISFTFCWLWWHRGLWYGLIIFEIHILESTNVYKRLQLFESDLLFAGTWLGAPKTMSFRRKMVVPALPTWHLRCKRKFCNSLNRSYTYQTIRYSIDSMVTRFFWPWLWSLVEPLAWVSFERSKVLSQNWRTVSLRWQTTNYKSDVCFYLCKLNQIYMYTRRNKTTKKTNSCESLHLGLTWFNTLKWLAYSSTISDEKDNQMAMILVHWVALQTMAMVRASRWARLSR